jgi:hypothetical protein
MNFNDLARNPESRLENSQKEQYINYNVYNR